MTTVDALAGAQPRRVNPWLAAWAVALAVTLALYLARDLLPWADPYIAHLVRQLQSEVRRERPRRAPVLSTKRPACELEPPSPEFDRRPNLAEWENHNLPQWPSSDRLAEGRQ